MQRVVGKAQERRARLREAVWGPDADRQIWHKREKGFCSIPRTLPLVATLIRELSGGVDAGRIYMDLWSRQYEDGFVDIIDEEEIAASNGYANGARGVRSWRSGMQWLENLGFIEVRSKGARKYGYVLLRHPHQVVELLLVVMKDDIPDWWVGLYRRRIIEIGTIVPPIEDR